MLTKTAEHQVNFVIDFDSTFTQVEGLDELAAIALAGNKDSEKIVGEIKAITDKGMLGEIGFADSLKASCLIASTPRPCKYFD
jgi:D-3-phosphoglycerate dehydrogenase